MSGHFLKALRFSKQNFPLQRNTRFLIKGDKLCMLKVIIQSKLFHMGFILVFCLNMYYFYIMKEHQNNCFVMRCKLNFIFSPALNIRKLKHPNLRIVLVSENVNYDTFFITHTLELLFFK